jgi:hypothetical protein
MPWAWLPRFWVGLKVHGPEDLERSGELDMASDLEAAVVTTDPRLRAEYGSASEYTQVCHAISFSRVS